MLRLGNDRQSFRHVGMGGASRVLLRVVGPPYYSLLRAIEDGDNSAAPRAYVQQGSRVWVQLGYAHPLADHIQPAPNQLLLIGPPHRWTYLDEARFHDIYEVLEFSLLHAAAPWKESDFKGRIRVPLRLASGGPAEAGELWVLEDEGVTQLDSLVSAWDDVLISRLAFAVVENDGRQTVVLRARPSREPPPVLVLRGVAYRSYLKLPNLFLPIGRRLHPPLRRDAVARRLAPDRKLLTWLAPTDDGGFAPRSLPDDAFRPLSDWVDYVLDHEAEALEAWVASMRFNFEPFVCHEQPPPGGEKALYKNQPLRDRMPEPVGRENETPQAGQGAKKTLSKERPPDATAAPLVVESIRTSPPGALEQRLR
jgi:hypothetical protein